MFNERLRKARNAFGISQKDLAKRLFISQQAYAKYETGASTPNPETLAAIAKEINVSIDYLLGQTPNPAVKPASTAVRINVYGSVPAGIPVEAIEDIVDWEEIPSSMTVGGQEYIGLRVRGDSMYPKYMDGDTVIIHLQPDCESGQDAVVYINGYDATLKKVIKKQDCIILQPLNPSYEPRVCSYNDEDEPVKILGIVVEIRRKV